MFKLDILKVASRGEIREKLFNTLECYNDLFPSLKSAKILIKPNLNSNMNALTGNTTDLRIVAAVIEYLRDKGYGNITIGEGTNSGFYRSNISVISRLAVDRLAKHYNVKVIDLNYSDKVEIGFENSIKADVARECVEADFFINMPKIKTHFEAGMSLSLKNLIGCLVGQDNKKKAHKSLARNILNINKVIKPDIHIVDGVISMEGLGPTRGTPVRTGVIITGTDPYLIDLICAKIATFDYKKIGVLKAAADSGLITPEHRKFADEFDLSGISKKFIEPKANFFASFIHSPKRQKYFLAIRNTAIFNYLCTTSFFGAILFKTGLRQDNYIKEEMFLEGLRFREDLCLEGCRKCADYCPVGIKLPIDLENTDNGCIECLYCFLVCPVHAIEFKGKQGFLAEQLRQYDEITRKVT